MRHAQSSVFERLSNALHMQFDAIAKEPLPERWVDLINYLNEKEEAQRRAQHWSDRAEEARLQAAEHDRSSSQARNAHDCSGIPAIGRATLSVQQPRSHHERNRAVDKKRPAQGPGLAPS